jgi:DNA-binding transcriptional regulator YiaG
MADLAEIGAIDQTTMREFDAMCLTSIEALRPKDISPFARRPE